jgi:hypothetical protein
MAKAKFFNEIYNRSGRTFFDNAGVFIGSASFILIPFLILDALFFTRLTNEEPQFILLPPDVLFVFRILLWLSFILAVFLFFLTVQLNIKVVVRKERIQNVYLEAFKLLPGYVFVKILFLQQICFGLFPFIVPAFRNLFIYLFSGMSFLFEDKKGRSALKLSEEIVHPRLRNVIGFTINLSATVGIMIYICKWVLDKIVDFLLSSENLWFAKLVDMTIGFLAGLIFVFAIICGYYYFEYLNTQKANV